MSNVTILLLAGCLVLANFYLFPLLLCLCLCYNYSPAVGTSQAGEERGDNKTGGLLSLSLSLSRQLAGS